MGNYEPRTQFGWKRGYGDGEWELIGPPGARPGQKVQVHLRNGKTEEVEIVEEARNFDNGDTVYRYKRQPRV